MKPYNHNSSDLIFAETACPSRVDPSRVRRSRASILNKSAALRRECWRPLDLFSRLGKSLPERNLWIPWAARWPPTLTLDWCHCLLFCNLFFNRFLECHFLIFGDFRPSLGTPQNHQKSQKCPPWRPSFFRAHALLAFLVDFL